MAYDEDLADRVRERFARVRGLGEKRMFGGLAFSVGGNLAVAVSGQGGLMVRVDPAQVGELLAEPGARPCVMRGRELTGWLRVDAAAVDDDAALGRWLDRGLDRAGALPPK